MPTPTAQPAATGPGRATLVAFLLVVMLGGVNAIAVRQSVLELPPLWAAALRFLVAGGLLLAFVIATRRRLPTGRALVGAVAYGTLGFTIAFGFISTGLRDVPAGPGSVLLALVPLLTFGLAILHRQERFHAQGLVGAVIALAGVAVVFGDQLGQNVPIGSLLLIVIGTVGIAESGVIMKGIPRADPFATNGVAMLAGGALLLVGSLVAGEPLAAPQETATWLAVGYLATVGSIALFGLYLYALQRWTASAVSYVTLLMPVVTISLATFATGERFSLAYIAGGGIVVIGVYVGAFLRIRPHRTSASSAPECLPVDACAEAGSAPSRPAPEAA